MTRRCVVALVMLAAVLPAWAADAVTGQAGKYAVEVQTDPSPPIAGENQFVLTVKDGGTPLQGAVVGVHVDMLDMPMPADFTAVPGGEPGQYVAKVNLAMAGKWRVTVKVAQMAGMAMAGDGEAAFALETGKGLTAGAAGGGVPWLLVGLSVLVLALVAGVIVFWRRPGARGVAAGLLTLVVVLTGTVAVVRKYRDPTVSTVIGSATMDMSAMQAAPGTVAVTAEEVAYRPFQASAGYTGTVVPDQEEDVYPRVSGRIAAMPFYPGDRVQRGQVLAQLDAQELAASAAGALGGVRAAQGDLSAAYQGVAEAASGVESARAGVEQARSAVVQAQADVSTMQADATYWQTEIAREQRLYKVGAISREELDRETAQAAAAQAKLDQAHAGVRAAQAGVTRAERELAQAQARHRSAQAAIGAARGKLEQAAAERRSAATVNAYTVVRASNSGVVTARYVAPGVVVQPGMSILKIAKLDFVRLQANVAEADLAHLRVGQGMTARTINAPDRPISAKITAIFPARDTATRTAVVEARVPNPGGRLQPGEYLTVQLNLGHAAEQSLSVPTQALVVRDGQVSLYVARADGPRTVARRLVVTTGLHSNDRTEVTSGLSAGERVITSGLDNLHDGDAVTILRPAAAIREVPPAT